MEVIELILIMISFSQVSHWTRNKKQRSDNKNLELI